MTIARLLHHGLLLLLLLAATATVAAEAGTNRTSCVAEEDRLELLRQRLGAQEQTHELLRSLRSGEARPGTTLAQLFVVDLADEEAVRRRVQELAAGDGRRADNEAVTGCLRLAAEFDTVVTRLGTVQADVSVMRLAVLRLPAARRALVAKIHELAIDLGALHRSEVNVEPATAEASTQTPGQITALRDQASRLLAAAQHVEDKTATRQQVTVLALWREILDHPLHLTALFDSSHAGVSPGGDFQARQPADERHLALLQARLRHAASLLRADLQQDRRVPYTTGGAVGLGQDLWREAREIPLHLAMPILAGAMQLVAGEQNGWRPLIPGLWNALLFGFSVWVALQLGRRSTRLLARAHDFIIRQVPGRGRLDWLGNLLRILTPFAPWLLAWLVIDGILHIADIDTGIVAQWLAPLARLYILFHLIRLLIDSAGRLLATAGGSYLHD